MEIPDFIAVFFLNIYMKLFLSQVSEGLKCGASTWSI
jgi:hypothetical protein